MSRIDSFSFSLAFSDSDSDLYPMISSLVSFLLFFPCSFNFFLMAVKLTSLSLEF